MIGEGIRVKRKAGHAKFVKWNEQNRKFSKDTKMASHNIIWVHCVGVSRR